MKISLIYQKNTLFIECWKNIIFFEEFASIFKRKTIYYIQINKQKINLSNKIRNHIMSEKIIG